MADRVETKNDAVCEYAKALSLSDVLCPIEQKAQAPAVNKPAETTTHIHSSPFGQNPERTAPKPWQVPNPVEQPKPIEQQKPVEPVKPAEQPAKPPEWKPWQAPPADTKPVQPVQPKTLPPFRIDQNQPGKERHQPGPQSKAPTVYVDIGHCTSKDNNGKVDHGFENGFSECEINKGVGRKLITELKSAGFRVVPTWNLDSPPPLVSKAQDLQRRNDVVNRDIAANRGDSIYLSIHHDNDSKGTSGQCVYYAEPKEAQSMTLARTIQASAWKVRDGHQPSCIDPDTLTNNKKLVGLRGVNTIGILIEGANVQNPTDKQLMTRPDFQLREAKAITSGVINYFRLKAGSERPISPSMR